MALSTTNAEVYEALQWKNKQDSLWLAVAKSSSWNNDENPPPEDADTSSLSEVVGYIKVTKAFLAVLDEEASSSAGEPTVTYKNKSWVKIDDTNAYTEKARQVFLEGTFAGDQLPETTYRQIGLFIDLETSASGSVIEPSDVSNSGILVQYHNDTPMSITPDNEFTIRVVLNFDKLKDNIV